MRVQCVRACPSRRTVIRSASETGRPLTAASRTVRLLSDEYCPGLRTSPRTVYTIAAESSPTAAEGHQHIRTRSAGAKILRQLCMDDADIPGTPKEDGIGYRQVLPDAAQYESTPSAYRHRIEAALTQISLIIARSEKTTQIPWPVQPSESEAQTHPKSGLILTLNRTSGAQGECGGLLRMPCCSPCQETRLAVQLSWSPLNSRRSRRG